MSLRALFLYPEDDYKALAAACAADAAGTPAAAPLAAFAAELEPLSITDVQEKFVRTFEMNPDTTLDIGWHLYGEQYERGEFLVTARRALRRYEVEESTELPDHLSHLIPLIEKMEREERAVFATEHLVPALNKILSGLKGNIFENLVTAVARLYAPEPSLVGAEGNGHE